MPSSELLGDDLSAATLHLYLESPTFVEYFNSFLLLPAFSSHVFYNADTGLFEQVQGAAGEGGTVWEGVGVMSSASMGTLYLTDDAFGPSLDRQQSGSWVCQHRLPLFLRSDLYSEYKLSRLLTVAEPERGKTCNRTPKPRKTAAKTLSKSRFGETAAPSTDSDREKSASPCKNKLSDFSATTSSDSDSEKKSAQTLITLPSKIKSTDNSPIPNTLQSQARMMEPGDSSTVATLPSLPLSPSGGGGIPRRGSLTALVQEKRTPRAAVNMISTSKSDVELGSRGGSRLSGEQQRTPHKRSLSSSAVSTALESSRVKKAVRDESSNSDESTLKLTPEEYRFLGMKTGMGLLWRFLQGTAGETSWLFWLDAERAKYYSQPTDQQRLLRDLRERYLQSGSPLKLPPESRRGVGGASLSLRQVARLQNALADGLKKYWCPRFILHHRHKQQPLPHHHHPHSLYPSPSPTPFPSSTLAQPSYGECAINYPRQPHPLTPSQTPTFRRLTSGRPRSQSSPVGYKKPEEGRAEGEGEGKKQPAGSVVDLSTRPSVTATPGAGQAGGRGRGESREKRRVQTVEDSPSRPCTSSRESSRKAWGTSWATDLEPSQTGAEERGVSSHGGTEDRVTSRGVSGVGERGVSGGRLSSRKGGRSSAARHSRLAKYTSHHLPDVSSRCASAVAFYDAPSPRMCDSRCQILSVSGTPLLSPGSPSYGPTVDYPSLVSCLATEQRKAGGYFQEHLQGLEDKAYLHCLFFWRDVQEYKTLFVGASFSPCAVEMKAKTIYGRYIVCSSGKSIGCPALLASSVSANLWPAYEDLFDETEEYALGALMEQWMELCCYDDRIFQKLDVVPVQASRLCSAHSSRHAIGLEGVEEEYDYEDGTFPTPRSPSPTKHILHPSHPHPSSSRTSPRHSTPYLTRTPTPSQSRAISLNDIVNNPIELEHFKVFLNARLAAMDLMCWMEIEAFRGIPIADRHIRDIRAKQLRGKFFCKKYFFGPSSPANKDAQRQVVAAGGGGYGGRLPGRPKTPVFREAQKHVRGRLEKRWLPEFTATPEFIARNGGSNTLEVKKISRAVGSAQGYGLEKSLSSSREVLLFRKALQERSTRELFVRYAKTKTSGSSHSRENIEFWVECQRYKEMCHAHTTEQILHCKVAAMTDCYFQSPTPPKLQIDIPQSTADQVIKKSLGPYLFREAQAAVFKNLFYLWQDYQKFCSGFGDAQRDAALRKLEAQMRELQQAAKERETLDKMEEKQRRSLMPKFETLAEREARLKREREIAEFGEVDVAFSLSTPNPNCMYYTAIPADEYHNTKDEDAVSETALGSRDQPWENEARRIRSRRQKTAAKGTDQESRKQCWGDPTSDRAEGHKVKERPKSKRGCVTVSPEKVLAQYHQAGISDPDGRKIINSSFCNQRMATISERLVEHGNAASCANMDTRERLRKGTPSPAKHQRPVSRHKFVPGSHDSVSMRFSRVKGSQPFPYRTGLPQDTATKLTITATS